MEQWKRFNLDNWAIFMAFDGEHPDGAAAIASRDKEVGVMTSSCCGIFGSPMLINTVVSVRHYLIWLLIGREDRDSCR